MPCCLMASKWNSFVANDVPFLTLPLLPSGKRSGGEPVRSVCCSRLHATDFEWSMCVPFGPCLQFCGGGTPRRGERWASPLKTFWWTCIDLVPVKLIAKRKKFFI